MVRDGAKLVVGSDNPHLGAIMVAADGEVVGSGIIGAKVEPSMGNIVNNPTCVAITGEPADLWSPTTVGKVAWTGQVYGSLACDTLSVDNGGLTVGEVDDFSMGGMNSVFSGGVGANTINIGSTGGLNVLAGGVGALSIHNDGGIWVDTVHGRLDAGSISGTGGVCYAGAASVAYNEHVRYEVTGTNTYSGGTTIQGYNDITIVAGSSQAFGTGPITLWAGTLDLNGQDVPNVINYRSGALVNMGSATGLHVTDSSTLGTTGLTIGGTTVVDAGGTLTGTGVLTNLVVNAGGTLSPGNSPGLLTVTGDLTINGTELFEIWGTTRGDEYDATDVAGLLTISDLALLRVTFDGGSYTPAANDRFTLFALGADSAFADNLKWSLPDLGAYGLRWDTSSFTTDGSISITTIPEPGMLALLGLGASALLSRRRARR